MPKQQAKKVYVTATDATTRKSKAATVRGMTPTQLVRLLHRIESGEVQVVERKQTDQSQVVAA